MNARQRRRLRRTGPRCPTCRHPLMGDRWCSFCARVANMREQQRLAAENALRWAQQILGPSP